jgi:hypothetical protein
MSLSLYSKDSTDTLLAAKLDLAGGTMTGGLTLSATGIIFSDATTLTTAPAGSTLAADQLTAGVVTANPTAGPTASGDVLQYNGTDLVWAAGGGGGGVAWGAITGTVTDQTDLVSYISGLGYLTAIPAKSVRSTSIGDILPGDQGNIVIDSSGTGLTVDFIVHTYTAGREILVFNNSSSSISASAGTSGTNFGTAIPANSWGTVLLDPLNNYVYFS